MPVIVEVRPSPVHGRGVFACRDIRVGETVCFYDGVIVLGDRESKSTIFTLATIRGSLEGFETPKSPFGIGQIINDGASIEIDPEMSVIDILHSAIVYWEMSTELANVTFVDSERHTKVVATKPIPVDSELFVRYCIPYWLSSSRAVHPYSGIASNIWKITLKEACDAFPAEEALEMAFIKLLMIREFKVSRTDDNKYLSEPVIHEHPLETATLKRQMIREVAGKRVCSSIRSTL